jgi:hypothetical protein
MKSATRLSIVLAAVLAAWAPRAVALSDAEAAAGRLVLRHYADAVVSVKLTVILKIKMMDHAMPPSEISLDVNGTVITPAGLTVTSLSAIDPRNVFEGIRSQVGPSAASADLAGSEIKGLRLRLADGTETPAHIASKNAELDLALVMPDAAPSAGRTFVCVNLNDGPEAASLLGNYYHLSRLSDALQRAPIIRPSTVTCIIERPRRVLLISTDGFADGLGCPVFDAKERVLGICLRCVVSGTSRAAVVVPAAEVAADATALAGPPQ